MFLVSHFIANNLLKEPCKFPKNFDINKYQISFEEIKQIKPIWDKYLRYTFCVVTQISTSRELNRVSPNNISEQSTRYVYEDGTICQPHWLEEYGIYKTLDEKYLIYKDGKEDDDINRKVSVYINHFMIIIKTHLII